MKIRQIKEKLTKNNFNFLELFIISLSLAFIAGFGVYLYNLKFSDTNDIIETYNNIKSSYYEDVNEQELVDAAVSGMMEYLDEKYSTYLDTESTESLNKKLDSSYKGIGVLISKNTNNEVVVLTVYDDTPASKSGILVGDIIKQIDDTKIDDEMDLESVVALIKDKDKIKMIVLRDEKEKEFNIEIKNLESPVASKKIIEGEGKKIGYIYLDTFAKQAPSQVETLLKELEKEKIDGLIFDVRSNTGGYLDSCTEIASLFLKEGKPIYQLVGKNEIETVYDKTKEKRDYPIIVLIDSRSASASEVLALALKESYGAIIVGTNSYGKGKVQQTNKLSDDTMVKYTSAKWLSPLGNSIDGIGITPGVYVALTKEYALNPNDSTDDQLKKAIDLMNKLID